MSKDINEIRKENLRLVIEQKFDGKQVTIANLLECAPNIISRYLSSSITKSHRNISSSMARRIEIVSDAPRGWLDTLHRDFSTSFAPQDKPFTSLEIHETLSENILLTMEEKGIKSKAKLAKLAGLGQSTVNRIVAKETSATIDSVNAIASALGKKAYELLTPPPYHLEIKYDPKQYAKLTQENKELIDTIVNSAINKMLN